MKPNLEDIFIGREHSQILFRIIVCLDFKDALNVCLVNKKFYELFKNSALLSNVLKMLKTVEIGQLSELQSACEIGYLPLVKWAIDDLKEETSPPSLCLGVQSGNLHVVKYLVRSGADVDKRVIAYDGIWDDDVDGNSIAHFHFHTKVLMNQVYQWHPLCLAAYYGHSDILRYLLKCTKAKLNDALYCAIEHPAIVKILLENGANPNAIFDNNPDLMTSPLCCLNEKFNAKSIDLLLEAGANINQCLEPKRKTPLHFVSQFGDANAVEFMIQKGAKVDAVDHKGLTPLLAAAKQNNFSAVKVLISNGADIDKATLDDVGMTALHLAIDVDNVDMAEYLITEVKADPSIKCYNGNSCFHLAVMNENMEMLNLLVSKTLLDINEPNNQRFTPLDHLVKYHNCPEMLEFLLNQGANADDDWEGAKPRPLDMAVSLNRKKYVQILVELGNADIHKRDSDGRTVFHMAVKAKELELARYFVQKGALVNDPEKCNNFSKMYPIWDAVWNEDVEMVEFLIEQGADLEFEAGIYDSSEFLAYLNSKGKNHCKGNPALITSGSFCACHEDVTFFIPEEEGRPLHGGGCLQPAVEKGSLDIVKVLVEKGKADIHLRDAMGHTPFFSAAMNNQVEVMEYLVEMGANVNEPDILNRSPLYIASLLNYKEAVKFLLERGADGNSREVQFGFTPLHAAVHEDNEKIIELLLNSGHDVDDRIRDKEGKLAEDHDPNNLFINMFK